MTVANGAVDLPTVQARLRSGFTASQFSSPECHGALPCGGSWQHWWHWWRCLVPRRRYRALLGIEAALATCCLMQAGNEAVLCARFEDAQFFYQNDLTTPLKEAR